MIFIKAVYICETIVTVNLTDGVMRKRYCGTRDRYYYGEVPKDVINVFDDKETVFEKFIEKLGYNPEYKGERTLFKKREYINEYGYGGAPYEAL